MNLKSKIIFIVGSVSLYLLFLFPMWKIQLIAPQYPEGLEMHIWVNKIGGSSEFTIKNFNILNHYIGMAEIHEESFPELKIMPIVVYAFMATGFLIGLFANRYFAASWVALIAVAGVIGIIQFNHWLIEFGTNLDPRAPIKVPGATYIPPLLGTKMLLNFKAVSYPYIGSIGITLAIILGSIASYIDFKKIRIKKPIRNIR
jgi:copper chaperone NosL